MIQIAISRTPTKRREDDAALEHERRVDRRALRKVLAGALEARLGPLRRLGRGGLGLRLAALVRRRDGEVHPAVHLAARLADAGFAPAQRGVVAQEAVRGDPQVVRVAAQEAPRVDVGEPDLELVSLEFLQVLAAYLRRLGRLADGDAPLLAGFLKAFSDGLHGRSVAGFQGEGKNDSVRRGRAPSRRVEVAQDLAGARAVLRPDDALLLHDLHDARRPVVADPQAALQHRRARAPCGLEDLERLGIELLVAPEVAVVRPVPVLVLRRGAVDLLLHRLRELRAGRCA